MIRKLTATVLFCLMMVATATSQAGLRYCLCFHTVSAGDCECEELVEAGICPLGNEKSPDLGLGQEKKDSSLLSYEDPCSSALSAVLGEYLQLQNPQILAKNSAPTLTYISSGYQDDLPSPKLNSSVNGTRGSPPYLAISSVPLFLRHSVFLI